MLSPITAIALCHKEQTLSLIPTFAQVTGSQDARIDWASLGLPDWLTDRVERLGFRFPTGLFKSSKLCH
eukprot:scaffold318671_cov19-Tisochrysis_lutea.AAC.1